MRIRTIKPEAFQSEELWDLGEKTGRPIFQAFFGLVCAADRAGRFLWRPRRLKAQVLPYWDGDLADVLADLEAAGLVRRYQVDGEDLGEVVSFQKHQVVNNREERSKLPEFPGSDACPTRAPRVDDACPTRAPRVDDACPTRAPRVPDENPLSLRGREGKGRERKGTEGKGKGKDACSTRQASPTPLSEDTNDPTPCPGREAFAGIVPVLLSADLGLKAKDVDDGIREFVSYWTVGGGAGRQKTRGKWLAACRENIRRDVIEGRAPRSKGYRRRGGPPEDPGREATIQKRSDATADAVAEYVKGAQS